MERPQRIRKPNIRYDPNVYVLASFPKKNKHTVDPIDEHNGVARSSGFAQLILILAEDELFFTLSMFLFF